ncbi:MAG: hypothetical protein M3R30_03600, partial [Candidatus Eremiobacteraeota bacterium]|nr:hypothetical protein [Candidatus Eremiobacteraeota bacterium]
MFPDSKGLFPSSQTSTGSGFLSPNSISAGNGSFEEAGIAINSGGTYTGIYAEHTAYLPAQFQISTHHGGVGYPLGGAHTWDVVEGPLSRPPNGGCLSAGTYAANDGTSVQTDFGVNDWCKGYPSTLSLLPIDQ